MSRTWLEISRSAIRHNVDQIRAQLPGEAQLSAVIKADAYGLGVQRILPVLLDYGINDFVVATLEEGVELRERGAEGPILVLGGCLAGEEIQFRELDLTAAVFSDESVPPDGVKTQLEIDTGMTRLGVPWSGVDAFLQRHQLKPTGVYSQLASADIDPGFSRLQLNRFLDSTASLSCPKHLCCTTGLDFEAAFLDGVRIGIGLYGIAPSGTLPSFRPAVCWKTRVLAVNEVRAGRVVGYGGTFSTQHTSQIAVLPLGYADGFSRALSNCGEVLIKDRLAPVVGRVSMDFTTVDATSIGVEPGDEVVLIACESGSPLSPARFADLAGTIPYEVLTNLGPRVRRVLVD